jgi:hypothetical protein
MLSQVLELPCIFFRIEQKHQNCGYPHYSGGDVAAATHREAPVCQIKVPYLRL